jgi:hypothetical protein
MEGWEYGKERNLDSNTHFLRLEQYNQWNKLVKLLKCHGKYITSLLVENN